VIPFDFITEWRDRVPWVRDVQVEQDLIIARALVELFRQRGVARTLAFRGGTALYKLHLTPPARYSEDIDLVQTEAGPIGEALGGIHAALDPWLGEPRRTVKEGGVTLVYRMTSEGSPAVPMRLKIEINTREHFSVLGFEDRRFEVESRWFSGAAKVRTYALDELLGTKLRALYQRKKGRDLFDLWYAAQQARVDPARVVKCFRRYLEEEGAKVSRAELERNLRGKLADRTFAADIAQLLAPGVTWDQAAAVHFVQGELVARVPGEPWRGTK
jgi:predicted nucleotidyltransferase component of viral defense system